MNKIKIRGTLQRDFTTNEPYTKFISKFEDKKTGEQKEFVSFSFMVKDEKQVYRCKSSFEPNIDILESDEIIVHAEYVSKYDKEKKVSYTHFQVEDIKKSSF